MRFARALVCLWLVAAALPVTAQQGSPDAEDLRYDYATPEQALQEAFPRAEAFVLRPSWLDAAARRRLETSLRRPLPSPLEPVYLAYGPAERFLGYAVVAEEIGKYRPMSLLVALTAQLQVQEVQLLVYRESRGMDVRRRRFLKQFEGKDALSSLRLGGDIMNVTGATLSARAVALGVKRVLGMLPALYPDGAPALESAKDGAVEILAGPAARGSRRR